MPHLKVGIVPLRLLPASTRDLPCQFPPPERDVYNLCFEAACDAKDSAKSGQEDESIPQHIAEAYEAMRSYTSIPRCRWCRGFLPNDWNDCVRHIADHMTSLSLERRAPPSMLDLLHMLHGNGFTVFEFLPPKIVLTLCGISEPTHISQLPVPSCVNAGKELVISLYFVGYRLDRCLWSSSTFLSRSRLQRCENPAPLQSDLSGSKTMSRPTTCQQSPSTHTNNAIGGRKSLNSAQLSNARLPHRDDDRDPPHQGDRRAPGGGRPQRRRKSIARKEKKIACPYYKHDQQNAPHKCRRWAAKSGNIRYMYWVR